MIFKITAGNHSYKPKMVSCFFKIRSDKRNYHKEDLQELINLRKWTEQEYLKIYKNDSESLL